jgi:Fe2+ transport system protein FeoA
MQTNPKSLSQLKIKEKALITGFTPKMPASHTQRLQELGFREGVSILCLKRPPMGAPCVYQIGGSVFSIDSQTQVEINIAEEI